MIGFGGGRVLVPYPHLWYNVTAFHRKRNSHSIVSSYAKCQAEIDVAEKKGTGPCSEGEIGRLH